MTLDRLFVASTSLTAAATAHAGPITALPESPTVTLIFMGMAVVGLVIARQRARRTAEAAQAAPGAGGTAE